MAKRKTTSKKPLIVALVATFSFVFLVLVAWLIYSTSVVSHMKSIAHQFTPDSTWKLEYESSVPPTPFCLHDTPCPYYTEGWKLDNTLTSSEFTQIINTLAARYNPAISCSLDPNMVGKSTICVATYTAEGYAIEIRVNTTKQPRTSDTVTLDIQKNGAN